MRGQFSYAIGLLASVAAGAGSAVAADLPVRPPVASPAVAVPTYVPDWVGFYVGIHGGGGWGHTSFDPQFATVGVTTFGFPNNNPKGGVFGGHAGYNWQWGPVVGGLEIDFSGADIHESSTFFVPVVGFASQDFKVDELASARGRLGYLIFPNWLFYGTAGIGWGHTRFTTTGPVSPFVNTFDNTEFGWVAGAGVEWKFANNWLLRGEWLHYDFLGSSHTDAFTVLFPGGFDRNLNIRTTVDVARAGLSYKF
jgi:outer membrane immunogenic protein